MFGMVLAIGILVDDAIVVVENVERIMNEEGLPPKEATKKAMGQITGAIIGITLVLVAVFIPMAFFPGSVGIIYRQFSIAMVTSIGFSALLALSLTPALCATFLKPIEKGHGHAKGGVFGMFNRFVDRETARYGRGTAAFIRKSGRVMLVYLALVAGTAYAFVQLPEGFLPVEDQGFFTVDIQTPPGASYNRTQEAVPQGRGAPAGAARRRHRDDAQRLLVLRPGAQHQPGLRDPQALERARREELGRRAGGRHQRGAQRPTATPPWTPRNRPRSTTSATRPASRSASRTGPTGATRPCSRPRSSS